MNNTYFDLFIKNYNKILELESVSDNNITNVYNSLFATIKDINLNLDIIQNCIKIIKDSDNFHSHFRGKYLLNIATDLSLRENAKENFNYMLDIDKELVNTFKEINFLSLTSQIICYFKNSDFKEITHSLKEAQDYLVGTSKINLELNDLVFHTFLCCNYPNYIDKFKEIEEAFNLLCKKNYSLDKNISFSTSIPLSLSEKPVKNRVLDLLTLIDDFKNEKVKIPKEVSCILSYISTLVTDNNILIYLFKNIDNKLLTYDYLKPNIMNDRLRIIISLTLALVTYLQEINRLDLKDCFIDPLCIILINISTCEDISKSSFLYPNVLSK